jgi:hypothetical protein
MHHKYYIVKDGPLVERFMAIRKEREEAYGTLKSFCDEIGASSMYGDSPAAYLFDFPSDKIKGLCRETWTTTKPVRNTYYFRPKKNTPKGKEMMARIKALPACPVEKDALKAIPGLAVDWPAVTEGHTWYSPFIRYYNLEIPIFIISVPFNDYTPEEIAEYRAEREKPKGERSHWSGSLDHALWEAPEWMREVKEWEALKIIDDGGTD